MAWEKGFFRSERLPVPVVVVGNIYVGGTGKTPVVICLIQKMIDAGLRPGVVSRGYGRKNSGVVSEVTALSEAIEVGDEPLMIFQRTAAPVFVGKDRPAAARKLLDNHDCDVIVLDDGLQHYRLERDIEIAVVDVQRMHGNGWLLPAGPLRETIKRLEQVQAVVYNGDISHENGFNLVTDECYLLVNPEHKRRIGSWCNETVHAVAGIGNPQRFFGAIRKEGVNVIEHPFPDHHLFSITDLIFDDIYPVLMTEKDATKCYHLHTENCWVVPADIEESDSFRETICKIVQRLKEQTNTSGV